MNFVLRFFLLCVAILTFGCGDEASISLDTEQQEIPQQVLKPGDNYILNQEATSWDPSWSKNNLVIYHILSDPQSLHPTNGSSSDRHMIQLLYQRYLVGLDLQTLELRPDLIVEMPTISEDQLSFNYKLRKDINWDDGSPLTVNDVLFTFKANKCPLVANEHHRALITYLEDIIVNEDSSSFTMKMSQSYIQNIACLTDFPIIQEARYDSALVLREFEFKHWKRSAEKLTQDFPKLTSWATAFNDDSYARDPSLLTGLGQYHVEGWDPGQSISLKRKPGASHKGENIYQSAYPDQIIFKVNRDQNSQFLEFKSQLMDASGYLSAGTLSELKKDEDFNKNYHAEYVKAYNYSYMALNTKPGSSRIRLFDDKNVRRAMALLTPIDDMISLLHDSNSDRMIGPVSQLKPDFNKALKPLPLDPVKALELLNKAGWKDSNKDGILDKRIDGELVDFEFDLNFMNVQTIWKDMALMIQEAMKEVGVVCNPVALDFSVVYERARSKDFDAMLGAWGGDSKADDHNQLWSTEAHKNGGANYTGFGTKETDVLIAKINAELDDEKRAKLSKQFQKIVYDEQPYVFLNMSRRKMAIHKRFGNAHMYYDKPGMLLNNLNLLYSKLGGKTNSATAN